jgi:hypothetical protein
MLDLLVIHQAEFTINYYSLNLSTHCVNSSPADFLFSYVLLIPIRFPVCVLLAASLHCIHFSSTFVLARTKLADFSAVTTVCNTLVTDNLDTSQDSTIHFVNIIFIRCRGSPLESEFLLNII